MSEPLAIEVDADGDGFVLRVSGEIDLATFDQIETAMKPLLGPRTVTVDLAGVTFMDSSGLRALLRTRTWLDEVGGTLVVMRPTEQVRRVFTAVDLQSMLAD